jgi:hypothetical protein
MPAAVQIPTPPTFRDGEYDGESLFPVVVQSSALLLALYSLSHLELPGRSISAWCGSPRTKLVASCLHVSPQSSSIFIPGGTATCSHSMPVIALLLLARSASWHPSGCISDFADQSQFLVSLFFCVGCAGTGGSRGAVCAFLCILQKWVTG